MLTGIYDTAFGELELEGDTEALLKLADFLEAAEGRVVASLDKGRVSLSPNDVELKDLILEVRGEGVLLVGQEGTALHVFGSKEP